MATALEVVRALEKYALRTIEFTEEVSLVARLREIGQIRDNETVVRVYNPSQEPTVEQLTIRNIGRMLTQHADLELYVVPVALYEVAIKELETPDDRFARIVDDHRLQAEEDDRRSEFERERFQASRARAS